MAALDFPPSSASPWEAPNGVTYVWNTDGYWEADTSDIPALDSTYLKLDTTNDPVTGNLDITGNLSATGKITSSDTVSADSNTTLTTKKYVDDLVSTETSLDLQDVTDNGSVTSNGATFAGPVAINTTSLNENLNVTGSALIGLETADGSGSIAYLKLGSMAAPKAGIGFENHSSNGRGDIIFLSNNNNNTNPFAPSDERMRITSLGKVGIGNTNPTEVLDVNGAAKAEGNLTLSNQGNDTSAKSRGVVFDFVGGNGGGIFCRRAAGGTSADAHLSFRTGGSAQNDEKVRITNTGLVGIATQSPAREVHIKKTDADSIVRLETTGDGNYSGIEFYRETSSGTGKGGAAIWVQSDTSSTNADLCFATNTNASVDAMSTNMVLTVNGRLGIGQTSPTEKVDCEGNIQARGSLRVINVGDDTASRSRSVIYAFADGIGAGITGKKDAGKTPADTFLSFRTGGNDIANEKMRINSAGNVGIGAGSAPQSKLHVGGDIRLTGGVVFGDVAGDVSSKSLNDYEEGTWTPTIASSDATLVVTYDTANTTGTYMKVGKLVLAIGVITLTASNSLGDSVNIEGLPYNATNTSASERAAGIVSKYGELNPNTKFANNIRVVKNQPKMSLRNLDGNTNSSVTGTNITSTFTISFSVTYIAKT